MLRSAKRIAAAVGLSAVAVFAVAQSAPAAGARYHPVPRLAVTNVWPLAMTQAPRAATISVCFGWHEFGWGKFRVCRDATITHMWVQYADTKTDGHCVWPRVWDDSGGRFDLEWNCGNGTVMTRMVPGDHMLDQGIGFRTPGTGTHRQFW